MQQYIKEVDPDGLIGTVMDASLDREGLMKSLTYRAKMYDKAGFDCKAKFGMLRKADMGHAHLPEILHFNAPVTYEAVKAAIMEYRRNCESFGSNFVFEKVRPTTSKYVAGTRGIDAMEIKPGLDNTPNSGMVQVQHLITIPRRERRRRKLGLRMFAHIVGNQGAFQVNAMIGQLKSYTVSSSVGWVTEIKCVIKGRW